MYCEAGYSSIWKAGELVPAGTYVRVDDASYRKIMLVQAGPLPPSFDGHIACYRLAAIAPHLSEQQVKPPAEQVLSSSISARGSQSERLAHAL